MNWEKIKWNKNKIDNHKANEEPEIIEERMEGKRKE